MAERFENLKVWKRSARLSADVYKALMNCRDYGFKDQLTRCGLSIPSNIAEGYERNSHKDCARFLSYAKGSCGELRTQVYIGQDIGYINQENSSKWIKETEEISSMLAGLIKARRRFASE